MLKFSLRIDYSLLYSTDMKKPFQKAVKVSYRDIFKGDQEFGHSDQGDPDSAIYPRHISLRPSYQT